MSDVGAAPLNGAPPAANGGPGGSPVATVPVAPATPERRWVQSDPLQQQKVLADAAAEAGAGDLESALDTFFDEKPKEGGGWTFHAAELMGAPPVAAPEGLVREPEPPADVAPVEGLTDVGSWQPPAQSSELPATSYQLPATELPATSYQLPAETIGGYLGGLASWQPDVASAPKTIPLEALEAAAPPAPAQEAAPTPVVAPAPDGPPVGDELDQMFGLVPAVAAPELPATSYQLPASDGAATADGSKPSSQRIELAVPREVAPSPSPTPSPDAAQQVVDVAALADVLVGLLEYRDPYFRGGSSITRLLAYAIGRELGLPAEQVASIELAAVLRDIGRTLQGRLSVRPTMKLDDEGRRKMERHVDMGLDLLHGIRLPEGVRTAIRHHHERWDGLGYPDGHKGDHIPLAARIIAVADSFSAMVAPRPYRPPLRIMNALEELQKGSGTQYDPQVIDALVRVVGRRYEMSFPFGVRQRIIVIDSDDTRAPVVAAKLCSSGYLAEVARDLPAARKRLKQIPADALVLGATLCDEGADHFIAEVRGNENWSELPIVVVGAEPVERRVALLNAGADICFGADARMGELRATLAMIIKRWTRATDVAGGAAEQKSWHTLRGALQDFPLAWVLQAVMYDGKSGAIHVTGEKTTGVIYLEEGNPRHAQAGTHTGEDALREMLGWQHGSFAMEPGATTTARTITRPVMHVLLDHAKDEDESSIFGAVKAD